MCVQTFQNGVETEPSFTDHYLVRQRRDISKHVQRTEHRLHKILNSKVHPCVN